MKHFYSAALMIMGLLGSAATAGAQSNGAQRGVHTRPASLIEHGQARSAAKAAQGLRTAVRQAKARPAGSGHFDERGGPPANDDCAGAITLTPTAAFTPVVGDVAGATQSIAAIPCAGFTGTADDDVWYKFVATTSNPKIRVVGNQYFDAVVDLRSGACNGTNIACADATLEGEAEEIAAAGLSVGTTYYVRLYHYAGTAPAVTAFSIGVYTGALTPPANDQCGGMVAQGLSIGGSLNFNGNTSAATITSDYLAGSVWDGTVLPSTWHAFTTTTCADVTIDYCGTVPSFGDVWIVLNTGCPADDDYVLAASNDFTTCGDDNVTMTFPNLPAGTYYLPVLAEGGLALGPYTILVAAGACGGGPVNDDCSGAITLAVNPPFDCPANAVTGDNTSAAVTVDAPACDASTAGFQDVWYTFNSGGNSNIVVNLDWGTATDLFIEVLDACGGTSVFCDVVNPAPYNVPVTPGTDYVIRVFSNNDFGVGGVFTICLSGGGAPTPNDDCGSVVFTPLNVGTTITFTGDNTGATPTGDYVTGTVMDNGNSGSVWHGFTTTTCTNLMVEYCGLAPTWDNAWVVLSLNCPADDDLVFNTSFNTADCGDGNVTIYYDNLPAGSYYFPVLLDAINNAVGPYSIDLSATACGGGPANEDCGGAITLAVNPPFDCPANAVTGDNTSAAVTVDAPACDASTAGFQDVWYTFNSGGNSNIVVNLDWGTATDLFIEVLDACGGTSVFCDVVNPAPYNVPVTPGTDYVIRVFSNNDFGVGGVFTICLSGGGAPTPNDDCANAAPVNVELVPDCPANAITGDNTGATDDGGLNTCDPTGTALDVWYTFNSLTNTTVTIDLAPVGGGTMTDWAFVVWDACGGTEVFCAVLPGGPVDVTVVPGIDYVVQVYSNSDFGAPGEFTLCISGAVSTALTETMQADLTVFPNPGNGELNIVSATTSGSVVIELFDVTGRSVHREQVRLTAGAVHAIMPAGRLTQGTYTLRLGTGAGSITRRVVVN